MRTGQQVRQACRTAVLPLVLILAISWTVLGGASRAETLTTGTLPRIIGAAVVPTSVMLAPLDSRLAGKPSQPGLLLFAATAVALLLGLRRRVRWPVTTGRAPAAKPSLLLHTVGGRAPPRRTA